MPCSSYQKKVEQIEKSLRESGMIGLFHDDGEDMNIQVLRAAEQEVAKDYGNLNTAEQVEAAILKASNHDADTLWRMWASRWIQGTRNIDDTESILEITDDGPCRLAVNAALNLLKGNEEKASAVAIRTIALS